MTNCELGIKPCLTTDRREYGFYVISLSFDTQDEEEPSPWIEGWRCVYDLKTGTFSVPPDFAKNNSKAVSNPGATHASGAAKPMVFGP